MVFNRDQRDHMAYLETLPPEERCPCGWEHINVCLSGAGMPNCQMVELEISTDPDVALVTEWQDSPSRRHPGDFLGLTPELYDAWVNFGVQLPWSRDPNQFPAVGYRVWETTRTVEAHALIYDGPDPETAALLYADADGPGQRDDAYAAGRTLNVREILSGRLYHVTVGLEYEPAFKVVECKAAFNVAHREADDSPAPVDLAAEDLTAPSTIRTYYGQAGSEYPDCVPRALANACIHLGLPHPAPGTDAWETVIDRAGCRFGTAISEPDELAEIFGLSAKRISTRALRDRGPIVVTVKNPEIGHNLHAVLIVGWEGALARVVDYRVEGGPLLETLPIRHEDPPPRSQHWEALYVPPPPNDRAYLLSAP